jgi:hypothetical protein
MKSLFITVFFTCTFCKSNSHSTIANKFLDKLNTELFIVTPNSNETLYRVTLNDCSRSKRKN